MTPIERMSTKSEALAVLGLNNTTASASDIKSAYRARVKEKHPDRCDGNAEAFLQITHAFEFLSGEISDFDPTPYKPEPVKPVYSRTPRPKMDLSSTPSRPRPSAMSRPVSKPSLKATETRFSTDILSACKSLLGENAGLLATKMQRAGRRVTYIVPVRVLHNVNLVAVPTGDLVDTRHIKPTLLKVIAKNIVDGAYEVPSTTVEERFPGARSVRIRFIADT